MGVSGKKKTLTFSECCHHVAVKHGLGKTLVTGHKASYFLEAADMAIENAFKEGFIASVKFYDIRVTGHLADDSIYESVYLQYQKSLTKN